MPELTPEQEASFKRPTSKKNKIWWVILIVGPFVGLVCLFLLWTITKLAFDILSWDVVSGGLSDSPIDQIQKLVTYVISLLTLLCVIGIPVGLVWGIILINKKS